MGNSKIVEGKEVRRVRELLGLTQEAFAKVLGVTKVTVVRWESGDRACKGASAMKIYDLELKKQGNRLSRTHTIFSIDVSHFSRLDGGQAIRLFRELLHCEVRRVGITVTKIAISEREIGDGGIDARIRADTTPQSSILQSGGSFFQIKAGSSSKPWRASWPDQEVLVKDRRSGQKKLGEEVERCLQEGGRYILVCFGHDLTPQQISQAESHLQDCFVRYGYKDAKVEVWGQQQLQMAVSPFLPLCLQITGRTDLPFKTYDSWHLENEMSCIFAMDDERKELIRGMREALLDKEARHIRILGDAQIGKTRLVLEALSDPMLRPHVAYVNDADDFLKSPLFTKLSMAESEYDIILILDNCTPQARVGVWNTLRNHATRCTLISIEQNSDGVGASRDMLERVFVCPPLSDSAILEILGNYVEKSSDLRRWVEFCSGSPRIAYIVGQNLRTRSLDVLLPPSTALVWDSYLKRHRSGEEDKAEIFVLRHLALFAQFGFEDPEQEDATHIQKLVEQGNRDITWPKFQEIIDGLRKRGILKGKVTLHIDPKAFHVHLWTEFWEKYGRGALKLMLKELPHSLLRQFARMFPYAGRSEIAIREFRKLFSVDGLFCKDAMLTPDTCELINEVVESFPAEMLQFLEQVLLKKSRDELQDFREGRQSIIFSLEKIAWHSDLCCRAASVLLRLAEAENANHANNATGVFAALFHFFPGIAPSGASYMERIQILEIALSADSSYTRSVGLVGCSQALSLPEHAQARLVGSEYQGLNPTRSPWIPKTWGEYNNAMKDVWNLLFSASRKWSNNDRSKANMLLIEKGRYLLKYEHYSQLHQDILNTLNALVEDEASDKKHLVDALTTLKKFPEAVSKDVLESLRLIEEHIAGEDFLSQLNRWVHLGSHNDRWGDGESVWNKRIEELAQKVSGDSLLFQEALPNLAKEFDVTAWEFGKALSQNDPSQKHLFSILESYRLQGNTASTQFLSGYLKPIYDARPNEWNQIIAGLVNDAAFAKIVSRVIVKSGFNDFAVELLLEGYDQQRLSVDSLVDMNFAKPLKNIEERHVQALTKRLLEAGKIAEGLEVLEFVFCSGKDGKKLPEDLTMELLKAQGDLGNGGQYYWRMLAQQCISQFPQHQYVIANLILSRIAQEIDQFYSDREVAQLMENILKKDAGQSWTVFSVSLENRSNLELFRILQWFKMHLSIQLFPMEKVWAWVSESPEERAPIIAEIVPPGLMPEGCFVRELLDRHGDNEKVQQNLVGNFFSGSWTGAASQYFQSKKDIAEEWRKKETSMRVKKWLDKYIGVLSSEIENALIREERDY